MKGTVPPSTVGPNADECDALLREFVQQPVPPMTPAEARDLRAIVVDRLDVVQARRVRRRAVAVHWRHALAVAACAAVLFGTWRGVEAWRSRGVNATEVTAVAGSSAITREGSERPLPNAGKASLSPSDELRTGPGALARASLPTGAHVDIGPSSRLRFERGGDGATPRDRIELMAGRIDVQVPKLAEGSEVRVHTEDATVVVHGTKFSVERTDAGETRVGVTEGKVAVYTDRGERTLLAGNDWVITSSPSTAPDSSVDAPARADSVPDGNAAGRPRTRTRSASRATSDSVADGSGGEESSLKAENVLLAEALRFERGRQNDRALSRLDDLLTLYPDSPLAETARVERVRVLQAMGATARLQREGTRYLADYPHGFARQEVARLIGTTKASTP